jgi:hypothetical protein
VAAHHWNCWKARHFLEWPLSPIVDHAQEDLGRELEDEPHAY